MRLPVVAALPEGPETRPPLLVANGLFGSARNWGSLSKRLAQTRRVLAVDMRNHGAAPWSDAHGYADMAGDLAETIVAETGGAADVLGHSMGGKAAMTLALTTPGRVGRLIVADIAPVAYGHTHAHEIEAMKKVDLSAVERRSQADRQLAPLLEDRAVRAFLLQSLATGEGGARWQLNLDALGAAMDALVGWPDVAGRFDGPTLFLSGGASHYVRPEHHAAARALFPAAEFEAMPGAGHWLHAEQPGPFAEAALRFLDA